MRIGSLVNAPLRCDRLLRRGASIDAGCAACIKIYSRCEAVKGLKGDGRRFVDVSAALGPLGGVHCAIWWSGYGAASEGSLSSVVKDMASTNARFGGHLGGNIGHVSSLRLQCEYSADWPHVAFVTSDSNTIPMRP